MARIMSDRNTSLATRKLQLLQAEGLFRHQTRDLVPIFFCF